MATGTTAEQIIDVVTPAAGESVTEGTILEWHVKVGDAIKADATIVEISTDKVDVELPSPAAGTVVELLVEEGDTVTVGQVIARIAVGDGASAPLRATAPLSSEDDTAEQRPAPAHDRATAQPDGNGSGNGAAHGDASAAGGKPGSGQLVDVVTPAAGESVTEGTILEWHVKVGDVDQGRRDDRRDLDRQGRRRAARARQPAPSASCSWRRATRSPSGR